VGGWLRGVYIEGEGEGSSLCIGCLQSFYILKSCAYYLEYVRLGYGDDCITSPNLLPLP